MKILFGILLAASIGAVSWGLGGLSEHHRSLGLITAGLGLALGAAIFIWVPGFMNRREELQRQADRARADQIAARIALTAETFEIGRRSRALVRAIVLTVFAGALLCAVVANFSFAALAVGCVLAIFAFFAWLTAIPRLSAPALSFTRAGLGTALFGFLAWERIGGMQLVHYGRIPRYTLELFVADADALRSQMHPCGRLLHTLASGRMRMVLRLRLETADAALAERLARALWERHTKRPPPNRSGSGGRQTPSTQFRPA